MTDVNRDVPSSPLRHDLDQRRQPLFMPLDVAAFVVAVLMVWGPLVAGALRQ